MAKITSAIISCIVALTLAFPAEACKVSKRSKSERAAFIKAHPCPSTGSTKYASCPGYVVDHVIPLCASGPDKRENMAWQHTAKAAEKDKLERKQCAELRKKAKS